MVPSRWLWPRTEDSLFKSFASMGEQNRDRFPDIASGQTLVQDLTGPEGSAKYSLASDGGCG